jgi:hypothetical protein
MGATFSSGASVAICTDKPQYLAGQSVQAAIRVNLSKPLRLTRLYAQVTGFEKTCVQYEESYTTTDSDGKSQTEYRTEYDRCTTEFYQQTVNLAEFGGKDVLPCALDYNVSFQLPLDGPSTFHVTSGGEYAHICYEVEVRLQRPGITKWDKVSTVEVDVVAPSLRGPPMATMIHDNQNITTCCCCHRCHTRLNLNLLVKLHNRDNGILGVQWCFVLVSRQTNVFLVTPLG